MILWRASPLSNARCHCTEYYKYSQILPQRHTWLEIQNSITKIPDITLAFLNLYQLYILVLPACIAHCKFYTLNLSFTVALAQVP